MKPSSFSVVIPVHNKERHVLRSLNSALDQTLAPHEIIIVDDASSDRSIELLKPLANDRMRFLSRQEPGPGGYAARNLAIEHATGEWIAFLDADDAWTPDHLATLQAAIEGAPATTSCVFSGYERKEVGRPGVNDWYTVAGRRAGVRTTVELLDDWLHAGCPLWMGAVAIRKTALLDAGMFPAGRARRGGDRVLWLKTILRTDCAYTGKVTATYYCDADNRISTKESYSISLMKEILLEEIPIAAPEAALRLKKIFNAEVHDFAFRCWVRSFPIQDDDFRSFFVAEGCSKYALIRMMQAAPLPFPPGLRTRLGELRRNWRGKKSLKASDA